jgi:hypothetical protein
MVLLFKKTCLSLTFSISNYTTIIFWNVLWVTVGSFPIGALKQMDTYFINGMTTLTLGKWATIGCGKPRFMHNIGRKWVGDKRNASVVGQGNNQMSTSRVTHDWKFVYMIYKGTFIKSDANLCSCRRNVKKTCN